MSDNPFAAPLVDADGRNAPLAEHGEWWIEGDHLVCEHGTVLPPVSIRSGASEDLLVVKSKLTFVPWPVYLLIFLNIFILAIVALIVRKRATLTYSQTHKEKRADRRSALIAFLLGVGGVIAIIAIGVHHIPAVMLVGVAMVIGAIVIVVRRKPFTVVKIKDGWIRLKLRPAAREALQALQKEWTADDLPRTLKRS